MKKQKVVIKQTLLQNKRIGCDRKIVRCFQKCISLSTGFEYRADNSLVMCTLVSESRKHTYTSFSSGHLSKTVLLESIAMVMNDVIIRESMIDRCILFTSQFLSTAIASQSHLFFPISLFFLPFCLVHRTFMGSNTKNMSGSILWWVKCAESDNEQREVLGKGAARFSHVTMGTEY